MKSAPTFLILLLSLLVSSLGMAQMPYSGLVLDANTGEPISHASVRLQGTVVGALTDAKGKFEVNLLSRGVILEVTHVGYKPRYIKVERITGKRVEIQMEEREIRVDDVVISDGLQRVIKDEKLYLIDYEFWEDELFILLFDKQKKQPVLALIDENDSIIDIDPGPERPKKLIKDCLGNVHMISENLACQVFSMQGEIGMFQDSLSSFNKYVAPCIGKIDEYYYYDFYRFNNQMLDYYAYNGETREGGYFCPVRDEERMHQLLDPVPENIYRAVATTEEEFLAIRPSGWEKLAKANSEFQFYQMAFFHPVHAPLRTINGKVYVFDHVNSALKSFDPTGNEENEVHINYHKRSNWDRFIITDPVRGEAYTSYTKHGVITLAELDLTSGEIIDTHELPRQFTKKVSVRDGVVYFLYQEHNYDDVKRLYRLRIKD